MTSSTRHFRKQSKTQIAWAAAIDNRNSALDFIKRNQPLNPNQLIEEVDPMDRIIHERIAARALDKVEQDYIRRGCPNLDTPPVRKIQTKLGTFNITSPDTSVVVDGVELNDPQFWIDNQIQIENKHTKQTTDRARRIIGQQDVRKQWNLKPTPPTPPESRTLPGESRAFKSFTTFTKRLLRIDPPPKTDYITFTMEDVPASVHALMRDTIYSIINNPHNWFWQDDQLTYKSPNIFTPTRAYHSDNITHITDHYYWQLKDWDAYYTVKLMRGHVPVEYIYTPSTLDTAWLWKATHLLKQLQTPSATVDTINTVPPVKEKKKWYKSLLPTFDIIDLDDHK